MVERNFCSASTGKVFKDVWFYRWRIYIYIYIYIFIHTHAHTHTHIYIYLFIHTHAHTHTHIYIYLYTHTHTHTHTHIYIYLFIHAHTHTHTHTYIYVCVYIYTYIYWQHFFIDTYLIEHNRNFLSTYFFVNPFELPYWSYDIWLELVNRPSIISYFSSTFCPTLDHHHQGRMYYKSDATFVCTLLLCKKKSVCTVVLCSVYF